MDNLNAQEILAALPTEYFVIDLKSKTIIQTNRQGISPGSKCYSAIFNRKVPCEIGDDTCFCNRLGSDFSAFEFSFDNEKSNTKVFYSVKGKRVKDNIVMVVFDEPAHSVAEHDKLMKNGHYLEGIEKLANVGCWELDVESQMIHVSPGYRTICGEREDVIGLNKLGKRVALEDRSLFHESLNGLVTHGASFDINYKIHLDDGSVIRQIHSVAEYREDEKKGYGIVVDITETAETCDALIRNKDCLSLLFENMNSAFALHEIITNDQGEPVDYVYLYVNRKFEEIMGLKREQVLSKTGREVMPNVEDCWIERYGKVALTGEPEVFAYFSKYSDKYFEESIFSPRKNFFALHFFDVTDRKVAEQELVVAKENAVESDRLKTLFLANMSHEIRTPLNGILGFSNLLTSASIDEKQRLYYKRIIENSGHRLMTVIDDIVNISMIQSNQLRIDYSEFDLVDLLKEIFVFYQKQQKKRFNEIDFKLKSYGTSQMVFVYSDKDRIFQVVKNLLDNAFKFTKKGFIEFGVKKAGVSEVELYVKDSGIGIKESKQSMIFDTFRQAEEGQGRKYEGSGLGLAIVSGILDKLNGSVEVQSVARQGSEFVVRIPRNEHELHDYTIEMITPEAVSEFEEKPSKTIVSFEDDDFSIEFLNTVLGLLGYEHVNFVYAKEGIKYLRKNKVDLILMDVQLPKINGYKATKLIKAEFPEIPIIIQTAFAMTGDRENAYKSGCDDYIAKPISIDILREKIQKCLALEVR